MALLCSCPRGAAIVDIPLSDCPDSLGQVQKVIFQRVYSVAGTLNSIATPKILASWTPLLAAADGTKVVQSPYIQAPTTEPGAARTFGGGNETMGGVELVIGREPTTFTGSFLQVVQSTIAAVKELQCDNVGVWLVDENGRIGCLVDDTTTPTAYYPIPIYSLFVSDKALGGLEAPDSNAVTWKFKPNWSDKLVIIEPTDFNALTDLITP